jgi:hypothetical protein
MSYTQFQNKTNAFQIEAGNDGLNLTTDLKKYSNVNEVTPDIQDVIQRYFTSTSSVRTATFYPAAADFNTTFNKRKCSYNELNNTSTINFNLQNADAAAIIPDGVNLYGVYAIACPHSTKTSVNFTMDMTTVVSNLSFITYGTNYWGSSGGVPGKFGGYTSNIDGTSPITTGQTFNLTRSSSVIQFMIAKISTPFTQNNPVTFPQAGTNNTIARYTGDIFASYNIWYVAKYEYNIDTKQTTKLSTGLDYSQIMPQNYRYFVYDRPSYSLVSNEFIANLRGNIPGISSYVRHDTVATGGSYVFRQVIDESMYSTIGPDMTLANDLQVNAGTKPEYISNSQRVYWRLN